MFNRRNLAAVAAGCLALTAFIAPNAEAKPDNAQNRLQDLQVLSITDFHGALETGGTVTVDGVRVPAGGAAYLATHLHNLRDGEQRSVTFSVGDNVGATPLVSAAFYDEPTIEALNLLGVDASTIGNHEFDQGYREMLASSTAVACPTATAPATRTPAPTAASPGPSTPTWPRTSSTPTPTRPSCRPTP